MPIIISYGRCKHHKVPSISKGLNTLFLNEGGVSNGFGINISIPYKNREHMCNGYANNNKQFERWL